VFSIDRWEFLPISQLISLIFKLIFYIFLAIWSFQVSLRSNCRRRYLTDSALGMMVWLILTAGQWPFRRVNVIFKCVFCISHLSDSPSPFGLDSVYVSGPDVRVVITLH
jgi:hypothetical protein